MDGVEEEHLEVPDVLYAPICCIWLPKMWRLLTAFSFCDALHEIGIFGRRDGRVPRVLLGAMAYECISRCDRAVPLR